MPIDYGVITDEFERHWSNREYKEALAVYYYGNRPFWLADDVAGYFERTGQIEKAMQEYEYLVNAYLETRQDFLPLPNGPPELFKLGKWYAFRDKVKARKYLKLYLAAETECGRDPAFYLPHKNAAKRLLGKLAL